MHGRIFLRRNLIILTTLSFFPAFSFLAWARDAVTDSDSRLRRSEGVPHGVRALITQVGTDSVTVARAVPRSRMSGTVINQ